jgi:murein L,D-transpeptidase YcbB/YkuD
MRRLTWRALGLAAMLAVLPVGRGALADHVPPSEIAAALEAGLAAAAAGEVDRGRQLSDHLRAVHDLYARRGFAPIWTGDAAAEARGRLLLERLHNADSDGLVPEHYLVATLDSYADAATAGRLASLELGLSLALVDYAADVRLGRVVEAGPTPAAQSQRRRIDPATLLEDVAAAPDLAAWLDGLPPASDRYRRLRGLLAELRAVALGGGWTRVPAGTTIRPGMTLPAVPALRARLIEAGDLPPELWAGATYDAPLEAAVRKFQARHGLETDGVVGRATLAALNVPVERRIEQVIINMERRRHLPPDLGRRHVQVNIADFELKLVETDPGGRERTVLTSPVVVGTPYNQTPVFSAEISYVVVNPYWHVPRSIAIKELLPEIKRHPGYLAENDYTVWTADGRRVDPAMIDWARLGPRSFPYTLRQEPGDDNALGRIKIMFPNAFNVYLHDTPKRSLFARAARVQPRLHPGRPAVRAGGAPPGAAGRRPGRARGAQGRAGEPDRPPRRPGAGPRHVPHRVREQGRDRAFPRRRLRPRRPLAGAPAAAVSGKGPSPAARTAPRPQWPAVPRRPQRKPTLCPRRHGLTL